MLPPPPPSCVLKWRPSSSQLTDPPHRHDRSAPHRLAAAHPRTLPSRAQGTFVHYPLVRIAHFHRGISSQTYHLNIFHPSGHCVFDQIFHFVTGFVFALANRNLPPSLATFVFTALFSTVFLVETLRIRNPTGRLNKLVLDAFRPFIRAHETHQFAGIAYYTLGILLTALLFPTTPACLGMLSLASVDPIAAAAATFFTPSLPSLRMRHGKSLAGTICAILPASLLLFLILTKADPSSLLPPDVFMLAVLIAVTGAMTEFVVPSPQLIFGTKRFPIGLDDNALIPVVCAVVAKWILGVTYNKLELSPLLIWKMAK